jgi:hypothetical protein
MAGALIFAMNLIQNGSWADGAALKNAPDLVAWSLTATWFLAFFPTMALDGREIAHLPISRRDMWIVRWYLAVFLTAVLFATAFGASGLLQRADIGASRAVTIAVYCALYGGCYMAITAVFPLLVASEPGQMFRVLLRFIAIPIVGAALPFSFARYLPSDLIDVGNPIAGCLIAAAGVTIVSYFYQPQIVERPSPPRPHRLNSTRMPKSKLLDYLPGNMLTGLHHWFWVHTREVVLVTPVAFLAVWFLESVTGGIKGNSAREMLHQLQLLPFDTDVVFDGPHGFNILIFIFIGSGFRSREIMHRVRALRVLPMTAAALSLVLASQSFITAVSAWAWLLTIHMVIVGTLPTTLRPDILLVLAGGLTLLRSIELAFPGRFAGQMIGAIVFIPSLALATTMFNATQNGMLAAGALSLFAGVGLQSWLLRRHHKSYQFKPPTFFGRPMPS